MRLVHGVEGDLHLPQELDVLVLRQGLRRHVQQLGLAGEQVLADLVDLLARERGIEEVRDAPLPGHEAAEQVDLVLHQGDQRGDDNGRAFHHQSRQLITQRLAASGGHQDEGITPSDQVRDDLLLVRLEGIVAEKLLESFVYQCRIGFHKYLV